MNEIALGQALVVTIVKAACYDAEQNTPELEEWQQAYAELHTVLEEMGGRDFAKEFTNLVQSGIDLYGEALFLAGWRLRGNPDELLALEETE